MKSFVKIFVKAFVKVIFVNSIRTVIKEISVRQSVTKLVKSLV